MSNQNKHVCGVWANDHTFKEEEVDLSDYQNFAEAKSQIGHFIDAVYNVKRIHSSLGYFTPKEFEEQWKEERKRRTTTKT